MAKNKSVPWGSGVHVNASPAMIDGHLRLAAGVLKMAIMDAREGDPGAWLYLETEDAGDLAEVAGFDRHAPAKFAHDEWIKLERQKNQFLGG